MQLSRRERLWTMVVVLVALAAVSVWLLLRAAEEVGDLRWNTWVNKVQTACQPGSTEASVRVLLGKPDAVRSPDDPLRGLTPPAPANVPGAARIPLYSGAFVHQGYWAAHIYISREGSVIAYHIGAS